jgi:hypothetical protein
MNLFSINHPNNTNILIVIDSLDGGGAESQVLMLAHGLIKKGINTSIFTLRGGGKLVNKAKNLNLHVIEGNLKSKRDLKSFILTFILLCKTIRNSNKLALSSRNNLLNNDDFRISGLIAAELFNLKHKINIDKEIRIEFNRIINQIKEISNNMP